MSQEDEYAPPAEAALTPAGEVLADSASKLKAFWVSLVRTYAPKVVVAVVAWVAVHLGFTLSPADTLTVVVLVVGFLEGLWYLVARTFEQWGSSKGWPLLVKIGGIMLFVPKPPAYTPK